MGLQDKFPGVVPVGYSYSLGQGILHQDIPADPSDPTIPAPDYLLAFGEAVNGAIYDREAMTADQLAIEKAQLAQRQDMRSAFAAYRRNGPIPEDYEVVQADPNFSPKDGVSRTRYVFFYQSIGTPGRFGMADDSALYMQIQGYSENAGAWALPKLSGTPIKRWRQDFGASGPGQWKPDLTVASWLVAHEDEIKYAIVALGTIVITIMTAGVATAAIAAIATLVGVGAATATIIYTAVVGMLIAGWKSAITGDSRYLMAAAMDGAQTLAKLSPEVLDGIAKKNPGLADYFRTVGRTVQNFAEEVKKNPQIAALINAGESIEKQIAGYLQGAKSIAAQIPAVGPDTYKAALDSIGGLSSVGAPFLKAIQHAPTLDDVQRIASTVPWYAAGYAQLGALLRGAEIEQQAAAEKIRAMTASAQPVLLRNEAQKQLVTAFNPRTRPALVAAHQRAIEVAPAKRPLRVTTEASTKAATSSSSTAAIMLAALAAVGAWFVVKRK